MLQIPVHCHVTLQLSDRWHPRAAALLLQSRIPAPDLPPTSRARVRLTGTGLLAVCGVVLWSRYSSNPPVISATASNVVGTWKGPDGATLAFKSTGSFSSVKLPHSLTAEFTGYNSRPGLTSCGGGAWSIGPSGEAGPGEPPQVDLDFEAACEGGFEFPLQLGRTGARLDLFYYVGDPDDDVQYKFAKEVHHGAR